MHIIKLSAKDVRSVLEEAHEMDPQVRQRKSKVGTIDPERTHLNENLCPAPPISSADEIQKKIKDLGVTRKIRADAVLAISCIIDIPDGYTGDPKAFMESAYRALTDILCQGDENRVIQAVWHRDENRDHMHYSVVPVIENDGKMRLSAKDLLTKDFLRELHPAVSKYMSQDLGVDIKLWDEEKCQDRRDRESRGDRSASYTDISQYKARKERERHLKALESDIEVSAQTLQATWENLERASDDLTALEDEYLQKEAALQHQITELVNQIETKQTAIQELNTRIKQKQSFMNTLSKAVESTFQPMIDAIQHLWDHMVRSSIFLPSPRREETQDQLLGIRRRTDAATRGIVAAAETGRVDRAGIKELKAIQDELQEMAREAEEEGWERE